MSSNNLTVYRQFKINFKQENADALAEEHKRVNEADAHRELDEKMGNTLADFQMWPIWTMEKAEDPDIQIYSLTMKVVFKP